MEKVTPSRYGWSPSGCGISGAQLEAAGIEVTVNPEQYPNGRFARVHDPEGNPLELWEPQGP